jgi:hypothetical protein
MILCVYYRGDGYPLTCSHVVVSYIKIVFSEASWDQFGIIMDSCDDWRSEGGAFRAKVVGLTDYIGTWFCRRCVRKLLNINGLQRLTGFRLR